MTQSFVIAAIAAMMATGCADPATTQKLADLENKVAELEKKVAAGPARGAAPAGASAAEEEAANDLMQQLSKAMTAMDYDAAKKLADEVVTKYGKTKAARAVARMKGELDVIGRDAPSLAVDHWFQGETSLNSDDATLLVFWEVWCPHCKREVPKLEATYQSWKDKGVNVVGLTKQSRDISDAQVSEFVSGNGISYAVAREKGQTMSDAFGVRGVPAAAVVKDGKIVWRGHPARITDDMLKSWAGEG